MDVEEVANCTVECLKSTVPSAVPGCAFLSGGQSNEDATAHLNKMNKIFSDLPWNLTFSYGRALQTAALEAWSGQEQNINAAKEAFFQRAKFNSLATKGIYLEEMEEVAI